MEIITKSNLSGKRNFNILNYFSILFIVLLVAFFTIMNSNFLGTMNIGNILADIAPLLVMGCGVTFVLIIGSIDLSIGSVCSCGAVIAALLLHQIGTLTYLVIAIFGCAAGIINGLLFVKIKIPSFIATLGAMSVWQSVAYILSKGAPLQIKIPEWKYISWSNIQFGVIPLPLILALLIAAFAFIILQKTKTGKSCYAIGANERAANIAGINTDFTKLIVFTICGLCSALTGAFLAAKLSSGIPTIGDPLTLMGVAAVALGGTSLSGGKGGIFGTILGVSIIIIISDGMNVIGVNSFWQQIVSGVIIILAVYMTADRNGRDIIVK